MASHEIRMLFCTVCNEWKALGHFSSRSLRITKFKAELDLPFGLTSSLAGEGEWERLHQASITCRIRCGPCGEAAEISTVNGSRRRALRGVCKVCCYPLVEYPPDAKYLKNTRRCISSRACQRCLDGKPPMWSIALSQTCRKILNRGDSCVLCFAVKQLALSTVYRCPWKGGLSRVAIFLGEQYCRQYSPSEGAQGMPVQVRSCVRLSAWAYEDHEVVRRACCSASWRGWKCYSCQRKHGVSAFLGSVSGCA